MQTERQTFSKEERLKSRKKIKELFDSGKIIHHYPFKVLYQFSSNQEKFPAQIAVSVSKKNFKRAVARNYIKRKMREAYRKNKYQLYNVLGKNEQTLHFFVIYTAKEDLEYTFIEKELKSLIGKISKKSLNN